MKAAFARWMLGAAMVVAAASANAISDWGNFAVISTTLGVSGNRLCLGEGLRVSDIGCPSYAPYVTPAGFIGIGTATPTVPLEVSGTISATNLVINGVSVTSGGLTDRITSGTLVVIANSATSYVSLSTAGTTWGYLGQAASFLPALNANSVSSTLISATDVQIGTGGTCAAAQAGKIRYNTTSNTLQICPSGGIWTSLISGTSAGASTLAALTDTNITNVAGRDYLRYDNTTSKWVNISESTVMSTTTSIPNFPDAISCVNGANTYILHLGNRNAAGNVNYYWVGSYALSTNYSVQFDPSTGAYNASTNLSGYDCLSKSITQLYAAGKAFNFIGSGLNSAVGTNAIQYSNGGVLAGDNNFTYTSGTGVVSASTISATTHNGQYASFTTIFNPGSFSGNTIAANSVSSTLISASTVSATDVQLGAGGTCSAATAGKIRYNTTSNTLQICPSTGIWTSLASGTANATVGGATTQAQFNDNGVLNGTANFTFISGTGSISATRVSSTYASVTTISNPGSLSGNTIAANSVSSSLVSASNISGTLIQIGASATTCSSAISGSIRYGSASNTLQICTGTGWVSLASSTTSGVTGGTANYGAVFSGATTLTTDTALYIDTSTHRLGVGTNAPNATLNVSGSLVVSTSAQIGSPTLYVSSTGLIGIGTTAPFYQLDVYRNDPANAAGLRAYNGDATATSQAQIEAGNGNGVVNRITAYGSTGYYGTYSNHPVGFTTNNLNRLYISAAGNVGISTNTPIAKLDVAGTISASDAIQVGQSALNCATGIAGAIRYNSTSNTLQICNSVGWTSLSSSTTAGTPTGTGSATAVAYWSSASGLTYDTDGFYWDATNNRLGVGSSAPRSTLQVSGTFIVSSSGQTTTPSIFVPAANGYVGIGTNDPLRPLEVNNAMRFTNSSGDVNDGVIGSGTFATGLNLVGINTDSTYRKFSMWGEITQRDNSGLNTFLGNSYFQNNVGIGTSAPGTQLDVSGTGVRSYVGGNNPAYIISGPPNATRYARWLTNGSPRWDMGASATAESGSNVGSDFFINTFNDAGVYTYTPFFIERATSRVGLPYADFNLTGTNIYKLLQLSEHARLTNATSNTISWGTAGVAAPGAGSAGMKLQLYGGTPNIMSTSDYAIGIESGTMWFNVGGAYKWYTNAIARMTMDSNGKLGINNQSPIATLDITGTVSSSNAIQVGPSSLTCAASIAGAIRYSTTSSTVEYCNSSAWTSLGPSDTVPMTAGAIAPGLSVATGTWTNLPFNAEDWDTGNMVNIAGQPGRITITRSGFYLVTVFGSFPSSATGGRWAAIYLNGVSSNNCNVPGSSTLSGANQLSCPFVDYYTAGDYISLYVFQSSGGSMSVSGNMTATLLSPQGGSGGGSATPAGSTNDVQYNSGGALAADTGLFTYTTGATGGISVTRVSSTYASLTTIFNSGTFSGNTIAANSTSSSLISATNISGTLIQVGTGAGASCDAAHRGAIRYSTTSSTVEYCNSSAWASLGPSDTTPISFYVSRASGATQTITNSAGAVVNFAQAGETIDTNNNFNPTNDRFTPTAPGNYLLSGCGNFASGANAGAATTAYIRKNGASIASNNSWTGNSAAMSSACITVIADANGTSDYFDLYIGLGNSIANENVTADNLTYFTGSILGPQAGGNGSATPAGSTADVQYNSGGALAADTGNFTYASSVLKAPTISATTVSGTYHYGQYASVTSIFNPGSFSGNTIAANSISSSLVSSTFISSTYVQVSSATNVLTCGSNLTGTMRYTSGTMQVCDGTNWGNIGIGIPAGTIAAFAATSCPGGWTEYTASRGRFLRGIDNGAGLDPSGTRAPGNQQADDYKAHTHAQGVNGTVGVTTGANATVPLAGSTATGSSGGTETRPVNVAVTYCQYSGYGSGVSSCPTGFTLIGSGSRPLGCMQTDQNAAATWPAANDACFDNYGGRLPTSAEWHVATANYTLTNETGDFEWLSDAVGESGNFDNHAAVGNASITDFSWAADTGSYASRCFLPN